MEFALDRGELLPEEELFLLFGQALVDGGGDLLGDFADGGELDEYLGGEEEAGFGVWGAEDRWELAEGENSVESVISISS